MVFGFNPFRGNSQKSSDELTVTKEVNLEQATISAEMKDLLQSLLQKDPALRRGKNEVDDFRNHPFFADVMWDEIATGHAVPPFIPSERANVNGLHDFEDQFPSVDEHSTPTPLHLDLDDFDFVNPLAYRSGFFNVPKGGQSQ
eukprot:c130_g1_i2.p1 GENE.c130_g1_i2~~c130_g1_i2.p1  ORF type:complete len:143 (+),score=37.57 c130_g1_i2:341-769(+)